MKTLSKSRDLSFDVTRVVCTLWIVGIWHLMNYIPNQAPAALTTGIGEPVTITALSCFMFISGYFLRKYPFRDRADVLTFYRKRFSRFYGLYFLSAITLLIGGFFTDKSWFDSYHQFFLTLCGLTTFSPPQPGTLWFMSMLMFFYLVTPFIQYGKSENQDPECDRSTTHHATLGPSLNDRPQCIPLLFDVCSGIILYASARKKI